MVENLKALAPYLPEGAMDLAGRWLDVTGLVVKLYRRKGKRLGAFTINQYGNKSILLNTGQNTYSFLITLAHEVAHMQVNSHHGRKAAPHGKEWKERFSQLLREASEIDSLPADVKDAMKAMATSPRSSSYNDPGVSAILMRYDSGVHSLVLLSDLPPGSHFTLPDRSRIFTKGEKNRTRFKCRLNGTSRVYLISGAIPVLRVA